jgi:hypothetical protein
MPKISVQLEADSAEEFQALLAAFHVKPAEQQVSTRTTEEALEPVTVRVPEPEAEQPAVAEAKEPAQPRRGRPRKEKPAEPAAGAAASVDLPVAETLPGSVEPEPEAAPEPVKPAKAAPKAKEPEIVVSRQDLLDAFSEYVQRYGASFGFSDISQLLQKNLGDGVRKASDVPEAQLQVAIGAIKTAIADNPFNRKRDYA